MTNKQKVTDGLIAAIVVVLVFFGLNYYWNHKDKGSIETKEVNYGIKRDAEKGTIIAGFPSDLAVDKIDISSSYMIPYKNEFTGGTTNQYTIQQIINKSSADVYNDYLAKLKATKYKIITSTIKGKLGQIYAQSEDKKDSINFVANGSDKATEVIITYIKSE